MKKYLMILIGSMFVISCNAQIDLESILYDQDLSPTIASIKTMHKDREQETTMPAYKTDKLNGFNVDSVSLSNYKYDNISYEQVNELYLLVDNYKTNKFIGYVLRLLDEKKANELIVYFQKKLGTPFKTKAYARTEDNYEDALYLWNSEKDRITFIKKHSENRTNQKSGLEEKVTTTRVIVIKKGLSITPDAGNNPEHIERILKENPYAFELIEVFKNQFQ